MSDSQERPVRKSDNNKLTAMMAVRNEAGRFLSQVLDDLSSWVDEIVILDDASTDSTPDICKSYKKVICLERNPQPLFPENESLLRAKLWSLVEKTNPDWILAIDADELFEPRMKYEARDLINQSEYDAIEFRLFDFWNSFTHFRVDGEWDPWSRFVRMLVRYFPGRASTWPNLVIHSGRWPLEYRGPLLTFHSDIRVKHLGWARPEDHRAKYDFYRNKEIKFRGAPSKHTESIIAPIHEVKLEEWFEAKLLPYPSRWEVLHRNASTEGGKEGAPPRLTPDVISGGLTPESLTTEGLAPKGLVQGDAPSRTSPRKRPRPRRVGILTTNHFSHDGTRVVYGGAERYGIELTRLLLDLGFEVEWWQAGSGWERELLPGVPIRSIPEGEAQFQTAPRLNHSFHERATGIDLAIYFVTFLAYPQALERSISISHGIYWDYPTFEALLGAEEARKEWLRRLFIALAAVQKVVSVDTATIHWANATWPGLAQKFEYIPNFVDLSQYDVPAAHRTKEGDIDERVRIVFPRRLTSVRGINEAARAAEVLTREYDNVEFHFVGRAHDDVLEKHMIRWASMNDRIFYYWRPPGLMPWVYQNMDIALIPSKATEGTSLACLEAMGAGCAVIAGYTGGLSDLIIDGHNGRLIKPTFGNLVDAIAELVEDSEKRIRLGKMARETSSHFCLENWRRRWIRVIDEVFRL